MSKGIKFECTEINFKYENQWIAYLVIYRPPWSSVNIFFDEFSALLDSTDMVSFKVFIVGDFNIWMDEREKKHNTVSSCEFLELYQ